MALIAFCAMALVENVTNAHPVRREEEGEEERMQGQWKVGVGREAEGVEGGGGGIRERTKTRQKGWTRRRYKIKT